MNQRWLRCLGGVCLAGLVGAQFVGCSDETPGDGPEADTGAETSSETTVDTGTDLGVDSGTDSGIDTAVDSGTDSDSGDTADSADAPIDSADAPTDTGADTADGATDADADTGPKKPCSTDGWCYYTAPVSTNYWGVWGAASNDVWVAGEKNTLIRWNGTSWSSVATGITGTTTDLYWVWGMAANDVWCVGSNGTILRFNGTAWAPMTGVPTAAAGKILSAVHGRAANDVWIAGEGGLVLHWNGTALSVVTTTESDFWVAPWAVAANDAWVVGSAGKIQRWNGTSFAKVTSPIAKQINPPFGLSSTDIWAGLAGGGAIHWDGTNWSAVATAPSGTKSLNATWAANSTNVFMVGDTATILRGGLSGWVQMKAPPPAVGSGAITAGLFGIYGFSASDVWAAGASGVLIHYEP